MKQFYILLYVLLQLCEPLKPIYENKTVNGSVRFIRNWAKHVPRLPAINIANLSVLFGAVTPYGEQ